MSLVPHPPSLPRVALSDAERSAAYALGRDILRRAAQDVYAWPDFAAGYGPAPESARWPVLDRLRADAQEATRALTERLALGESDRDLWYHQMRATLIARHYAAAMAAVGSQDLGWETRRFVDDFIRRQVGYLILFRSDLAVGETPPDGRALVRADLYGFAVWSTGQEVLRFSARRRGLTEERAILHAKDSCSTCLDRARSGWAGIGTLIAIGSGICRTKCQCTWDFR